MSPPTRTWRELAPSWATSPDHTTAEWRERECMTGSYARPGDVDGTVFWYQSSEESAMSITASEARKQLFPLIERVNNDRDTVEITSRRGNAVLISAEEFSALQETAYLLRVPANAKHLLESLQQALVGERYAHELAE